MRNFSIAGIAILCIILYTACANVGSEQRTDSLPKATADTADRAQRPATASADSNFFGDPNPDSILHTFYQSYNDTMRMDTLVTYHQKELRIKFLHYCAHDSLIHLPGKYLEPYNLKSLITHNFVSSLSVSAGDSLLLDTIIHKDIFYAYADESLAKYGILFDHPYFEWGPEGFTVFYSYTIPLTDVGKLVHFHYGYVGSMSVGEGE